MEADIIVDFIGAPYWAQNIRLLAQTVASSFWRPWRAVPDGYSTAFSKAGIAHDIYVEDTVLSTGPLKEFRQYADARFNDGRLRPVVDRVFDWCDVVEAHRYMEENRNVGKIVLRMNDE